MYLTRWLAGKPMATTLLDEKWIVSCHWIVYFLIFKVTKYF
jgi:hypothetical protein